MKITPQSCQIFLAFLMKFQSHCCGYGSDGRQMKGYDCVIIPTATKKNTLDSLIPGNADEFCGRALASATSGPSATICCNQCIIVVSPKNRSVSPFSFLSLQLNDCHFKSDFCPTLLSLKTSRSKTRMDFD